MGSKAVNVGSVSLVSSGIGFGLSKTLLVALGASTLGPVVSVTTLSTGGVSIIVIIIGIILFLKKKTPKEIDEKFKNEMEYTLKWAYTKLKLNKDSS